MMTQIWDLSNGHPLEQLTLLYKNTLLDFKVGNL
jgi:hypothetical protein